MTTSPTQVGKTIRTRAGSRFKDTIFRDFLLTTAHYPHRETVRPEYIFYGQSSLHWIDPPFALVLQQAEKLE
jgi:hypothetical protein